MFKNNKNLVKHKNMQGSIEPEQPVDANIITQLKETAYKAENIQTFLNTSKFSFPKEIKECKERTGKNFEKFRGNYLILLLIFLVVFVIQKFIVIPIIAMWIGYFYISRKNEDNIAIGGMEVKKSWLFRACIVVSIVYLIFFINIIPQLMITVSIFILLCLSHMCCFIPDEINQEENV